MPVVIALAPLEEVVVGFLLLLFLYATQPVWGRAVVNLLGQLPVVGGWVAGNVSSMVTTMLAAMQGWLAAGLHPVAAFFTTLHGTGYLFTLATARGLTSLYMVTENVVTRQIPNAVALAYARATAEAERVRSEFYLWINQLRTEIAGAETRAVLAAAGAAGVLVEGIRAELGAGLGALRGDLAGVEAASRAYADAGLRGLQDWTQHRTGDLYDALDRARADLRTYVDSGLGAATVAAAAALAQVAVRVKQIEDSPCQQSCDVLGNLGGELEGLELGLILAAVGVMARDPLAVGRQIATEAGPELQEAASAFRDLVAAL